MSGSGVLLDQVLTVASPTGGPFYVPQHLTFTANSATTTLTLADKSYTYWFIDGLLDNVRVTTEAALAPLVTAQPQRTFAVQGGSATFTVGASGTGSGISGSSTGSISRGRRRAVMSSPGPMPPRWAITAWDHERRGPVSSSAATLTVLPPAIVLNGSFEYGSAAWTFSNGSVTTSTNTGFGVTDGTQLVHFNWAQQPANGALSQSFATVAGQQYGLAFDAGAYSAVNLDEQRMQVTVQGTATLLSQSVSVFAPGNGGAFTPQSLRLPPTAPPRP